MPYIMTVESSLFPFLSETMWELLTSSAAQWVFGIAGTAILIAIAYYCGGALRQQACQNINEGIPTQEENLVEFDRMRREGFIENNEFQKVKKNLAPKIVKKRIEDREQRIEDRRQETEEK